MFIMLQTIGDTQKQKSIDELNLRVERTVAREMLEWLRGRGYIREVVKDEISFFSTTRNGDRLIYKHRDAVQNAVDKEEMAKKAFKEIKPIPLDLYYNKFRNHFQKHQGLYTIIGIIIGLIGLYIAFG